MFEIIAVIAIVLAIAIVVVLILAADQAGYLQRAAAAMIAGAGGADISADQRFP